MKDTPFPYGTQVYKSDSEQVIYGLVYLVEQLAQTQNELMALQKKMFECTTKEYEQLAERVESLDALVCDLNPDLECIDDLCDGDETLREEMLEAYTNHGKYEHLSPEGSYYAHLVARGDLR